MKKIILLFSALFLFALTGNAQHPADSTASLQQILDSRSYRLTVEREVRNNWGNVSDSFAIGFGSAGSYQPKAAINSEEVIISDHWLVVKDDKVTCRLGNILDYQLAGDKDVNKIHHMDVKTTDLLEYDITEYQDVVKKNKRIVNITAYHKSGVICLFEFTFSKNGKVLIRLFDKNRDQIREYKGVLDINR